MALVNAAVAALFFTSTAIATPTPLRSRELQPIEKRGFRAPAHRYAPKVRRDIGTPEADFDGAGWVLSVLIGGQTVRLNVDTGSSDLWTVSTLLSPELQSTVTAGYIFDSSKSSTFQNMTGSTFSIAYADGSGASGPVGIDTVSIGGAVVPNMPFGLCDTLKYGPGNNNTRHTDGPVGLGFTQGNTIRPNRQCTFMECLEPYVPEPIFGTKFRPDDTGFIDFGYVDCEAYTGDITSIPIDNSTGQWNANNVQFGSGGNVFDASPIDMDFDSGTPGLLVPAAVASAYFALVPGSSQNSQGIYTYPCGDLPDFDFVFSNVNGGPSTITIPGANLKIEGGSGTTCYTYMFAHNGTGNAGVPFYISEYMMWDQAGPSLSFAKQT